MQLTENLKLGIDSLKANPLRSILTLTGIAVGIAAVLYVVILGEVTKKRINEQLESLGSNILMIRPGESHRRGVHTSENVNNLTWDNAREIASLSDVITQAVPVFTKGASVEYQDKNLSAAIAGTTPAHAPVNNTEPIEGRFFNEQELLKRERVCILGSTVHADLFGAESPIGKSVLINSRRFKVIGLLKAMGESWFSPDNQIFIPLTTAQERLFGVDYLNLILAQIDAEGDYDEALFDIETILRRDHRLRDDQDNDFRVRRQDFFLATIQETNTELANFIILIALISLVVGGIGIANVMLVSVTERIREIGIRRAIGATRLTILTQFLMEAMVLGIVGGMLGILGGLVLNQWIVGYELLLPLIWIGNSFLICVGIGVIAGLYPAYRAAQMNVIESLRYE